MKVGFQIRGRGGWVKGMIELASHLQIVRPFPRKMRINRGAEESSIVEPFC